MTSRYDRQLILPGFGQEGQQRLAESSVLVIGLGGLGCPVVSYLASAGVGHLLLNDFDKVDESNLARQPLYQAVDIGRLKTEVSAEWISHANPDVEVEVINQRLTFDGLLDAARSVQVVVDASDNIQTRLLAGKVCRQLQIPLVFGAGIRWEGQYAVFRYDLPGSPGIEQLLNENDELLGDCAGSGVFGPLVGVIGSAMAGEAIKLLLGQGDDGKRLILFDARYGWRELNLPNHSSNSE